MVLLTILGTIVFLTFAVMGVLFFMLNKEGQKEEATAVPFNDIEQIKKELTSQMFTSNMSKVIEKDSETIPVFTPQATMPVTDVQTSLEDDKYKQRAQHLEDELLAISKKAAGQSDEAKQLIESLNKENQSLKAQKENLEEAHQKLVGFEREAASLKTENIGLQTQLELTNSKVHLLEEQMTSVKLQMGEEISRANATVSELNREKEALISAPKPVTDENLSQEIEGLKFEMAKLNQKCDDLLKTNQQLEYELVKARAQSSGLERISFNYKNQIEDFFKKINAIQVSNDQLSQIKNRLEGEVQEVQSQNEELIEKDKLAQFELEKNRSRLSNLERECEDLKARIQQQGQQ